MSDQRSYPFCNFGGLIGKRTGPRVVIRKAFERSLKCPKRSALGRSTAAPAKDFFEVKVGVFGKNQVQRSDLLHEVVRFRGDLLHGREQLCTINRGCKDCHALSFQMFFVTYSSISLS